LVFDYYNRLSAKKQSIYRQSDAIIAIRLPDPQPLRPAAQSLVDALKSEDRNTVQLLSQQIADGIIAQLKVPPLRIQVLAVRPSDDWGELHGLYLPEEDGKMAKIQLWMRTASTWMRSGGTSSCAMMPSAICCESDCTAPRSSDFNAATSDSAAGRNGCGSGSRIAMIASLCR